MTVIQVSDRELSRLRVIVDLVDGRLTVEAAATLMGIGRRQVYRLCRAFEHCGPSALVSKKRGRLSPVAKVLSLFMEWRSPCVRP